VRLNSIPKQISRILAALIGIGLLVVLGFSLNALFSSRNQQPPQTDEQAQAASQFETTSSAIKIHPDSSEDADNRSDRIGDWQTYTSRLSYTIKYPPNWFAAPDPAVADGDILYNKSDFLKIREGKLSQTRRVDNSYFVVGIEKFTFNHLDITPTDSIQEVARRIDGQKANVLRQEQLQLNTGEYGQIRIVEIWKEYLVKAYFLHDGNVFMVYATLPGLDDTERVRLFKEIASSIQFP